MIISVTPAGMTAACGAPDVVNVKTVSSGDAGFAITIGMVDSD